MNPSHPCEEVGACIGDLKSTVPADGSAAGKILQDFGMSRRRLSSQYKSYNDSHKSSSDAI